MSVSSLSKMQPDLLMTDSSNQASHLLPLDDMKPVNQAVSVYRKDLKAPKHLVTNRNDHELLSKHSRMRRTVADVIDECRTVGGNAYAEQLLRELKAAFQINRGPQGISPSSHLHWDMLLGKDETIEPCDYLNFDYTAKF
ncbi:Mediator complex domain containing protein [Dirofilaria immitis]|nr:Mediator complex domain containing protein [Dirofilaria immitis]